MAKVNKQERYFYTGEKDLIFVASTWKRFFARIIDLLLALSIITIIYSITLGSISTPIPTTIPDMVIGPVIGSTVSFQTAMANFFTYVPAVFSPLFVSAQVISILLVLTIFIILPSFLSKHRGQTIGKKMLGITPLFLTEKNEIFSIIKRELFITLPLLLVLILTLLAGVEIVFIQNQFNLWIVATGNQAFFSDTTGVLDGYNYLSILGTPLMTPYQFASTILVDAGYLAAWSATMILVSSIFSSIRFFLILALWISILANGKRMGIHDLFAKTAVVDLKTQIDRETYLASLERQRQGMNQQMPGPTDLNNPDQPIVFDPNNPVVNPNNENLAPPIDEPKKHRKTKPSDNKQQSDDKSQEIVDNPPQQQIEENQLAELDNDEKD